MLEPTTALPSSHHEVGSWPGDPSRLIYQEKVDK